MRTMLGLGLGWKKSNWLENVDVNKCSLIEQHILDTNVGKQLSEAATDV